MAMKIDFMSIILVLTTVLLTISEAERLTRAYGLCPPKFQRIGNQCYFVSKEKLNWLDAHFACRDKNSKLAEPIKTEDRALRRYFNHHHLDDRTEIWIGSVFNWERNKWQWGQTGRDVIYQSFSQIDPRSSLDLKYHCTVLDPNLKYRWSARICVDKHSFICQHNLQNPEEYSRRKNELSDVNGNGNSKRINPNVKLTRRKKLSETNSKALENNTIENGPTNVKSELHKKNRRAKHHREVQKRRFHRNRQNRIPDFVNDAAYNSTSQRVKLQPQTVQFGQPIVEIADFQPFTYGTTTPGTPISSTVPTRRHRKLSKRPRKIHRPRKGQSAQNVNNVYPEKNQFDDIGRSRSRAQEEKMLQEKKHREAERRRMEEERIRLDENLRAQEEKNRAEMERLRLEEESRRLMGQRFEEQQRLLKQKEERENAAEEQRQLVEQKRYEQEQREIMERQREEEDRQLAAIRKEEKRLREENRRKEEEERQQKILEEEERKRQEEDERNELEQKRLAEEQRVEAERLEKERRADAERQEQEQQLRDKEELEQKLAEERKRKRENMAKRLKNMSPEKRAEYLALLSKKQRQRSIASTNEASIPE